ncbi:Ribonuclease P protein component 2 [Candidatus Norongarragalina meridionalis]|nr:Ribonuclease P protein component 2 [Candidatus Norongarragalina meridionalis]
MIREKKRWLLLKFEGQELSDADARRCCNDAILSFLGESGASKANFKVARYSKGVALASCSLASLEPVIAALALKRFHEGKGIAIRLISISGSAKVLKNKIR